jgi:type IV pilus modification protein PilV
VRRSQSGFTLIEVMISILILTVGLLSMLAVFSLAMASTQTAQDDMIAKQEAAEAIRERVHCAQHFADWMGSNSEHPEWSVHEWISADSVARAGRFGWDSR